SSRGWGEILVREYVSDWGFPGDRVCLNATIPWFDLLEQGPLMNLAQYFPVLLFIIVATLIGSALLGAGRLLGRNVPDAEKLSAYECGFETFGDSRMKFDVRYYLVAILFIMFDLEIAFLFPWAMANGVVGMAGFW